MVIDLLVSVGYYIVFIILSVVIGFFIGWIVYMILSMYIGKYIGKLYQGLSETFSSIPKVDIGKVLSYLIAIVVGIYVFNSVFNLLPSILTTTEYSYISSLISVINLVASYLLSIVIVFFIIIVGLVFAVLITSYLYLLIRGYNEDIATLLRLLLFIGFVWVVTVYSLNLLGLTNTLFKNIMGVFVILSIAFIIMRYITNNIEENDYYNKIKPFVQLFIYSIFIISSLSILTVGYSTASASVEYVFALGFVILFVLLLIPQLYRVIKEEK